MNKVEIINDDYRNVIKTLEPKSINLMILDPFFNEWDEHLKTISFECLADNGVVVAFSNRPHTGRIQVELDRKLNFLTEIVWNFSDGRWVSKKLPRICHENILIYCKGKKNPLNDMRLLEWIDKPKQTKKGGSSIGKWKCENRVYTPNDLAQVESVMYLPRGVGKQMGIVSKPEPLMELILKMCISKGKVLDMFMGSGTTGVVCKKMGFDFLGVEKNEDNYNIAKDRINNTYLI